jgi:hypothetical protein
MIGVRFSSEARNLSLLHIIQSVSGSRPAFHQMETGGSFPGVKKQGREVDHSPPSNAEVKNGGAIPPLPHMSS